VIVLQIALLVVVVAIALVALVVVGTMFCYFVILPVLRWVDRLIDRYEATR
jgi:hypothetical protein